MSYTALSHSMYILVQPYMIGSSEFWSFVPLNSIERAYIQAATCKNCARGSNPREILPLIFHLPFYHWSILLSAHGHQFLLRGFTLFATTFPEIWSTGISIQKYVNGKLSRRKPTETNNKYRGYQYSGTKCKKTVIDPPVPTTPFEMRPGAQGFSIYERNGRKRLTRTGGHDEQYRNVI
jgi:hypothetical protein